MERNSGARDDGRSLGLPRGELLDVHGVGEVSAARVSGLAEEHVDPLRGVEGVPEDVGAPVRARPQERQARDHAPVPPDPAATPVHHAEPCISMSRQYSVMAEISNRLIA